MQPFTSKNTPFWSSQSYFAPGSQPSFHILLELSLIVHHPQSLRVWSLPLLPCITLPVLERVGPPDASLSKIKCFPKHNHLSLSLSPSSWSKRHPTRTWVMGMLKQFALQLTPNFFKQKHSQFVLVMDPRVNLSNNVITMASTKGIRYWALVGKANNLWNPSPSTVHWS